MEDIPGICSCACALKYVVDDPNLILPSTPQNKATDLQFRQLYGLLPSTQSLSPQHNHQTKQYYLIMCFPNNSGERPPVVWSQLMLPLIPLESLSSIDATEPVVNKEPAKRKRIRKPQKPGKTASNNERHFVQHQYHDRAHEVETDSTTEAKVALAATFPMKLHMVLEQVEAVGLSHIIGWQSHGRCFVIHKPKEFATHIMPRYFRQTKLTSFQRQLNLYGFQRITRGKDARGYYHEYFLRNKAFLTAQIHRKKVKGTRFKPTSNPDQEPDFYSMEPIGPLSPSCAVLVRAPRREPEVPLSAPPVKKQPGPPVLEPQPVSDTDSLPIANAFLRAPMKRQLSEVSDDDDDYAVAPLQEPAAVAAPVREVVISKPKLHELDSFDVLIDNNCLMESPVDLDMMSDWDPMEEENSLCRLDDDRSLQSMLDRLVD